MSGDGRRVFAFRSDEREIVAWNAVTGESLPAIVPAKLKSDEWELAVTYDGRHVAILPGQGQDIDAGLVIWDVDANRETVRFKGLSNFRGLGPVLKFSKDGTRLAAIVNEHKPGTRIVESGSVKVWDWQSGRELFSIPRDTFIATLALSADGRSVAIGGESGSLRLFEVASHQERARFKHRGQIVSIAFHPDGTRMAASSPDAPICVWDLLGKPARWNSSKANEIWDNLKSSDGKSAFASMHQLRECFGSDRVLARAGLTSGRASGGNNHRTSQGPGLTRVRQSRAGKWR